MNNNNNSNNHDNNSGNDGNNGNELNVDPEFIEVDENYFEKLSEYTAVRTHVWGPPTWFFLHSMAMAYPKKINQDNPEHIRIRNSMFSFLSNLGNVLPCNICSVSYNGYIKEPTFEISKYLNSRAKLCYFIYLIHEKVNKKLGVPQCYRPSFKKVIKKFGKFLVGPDQCKLTNIEQQSKNRMKDCESQKYNMNFKKYKSIVSIIDKDTNKIEKFENEKKENFENSYTFNKNNNVLLILLIIFILFTIILIYIQYKK
jgi:hypothetical protein